MNVRILAQAGKTKLHQNINTDPETLFLLTFPFLEDVVAVIMARNHDSRWLPGSATDGSVGYSVLRYQNYHDIRSVLKP